jgi:hypothetical protein
VADSITRCVTLFPLFDLEESVLFPFQRDFGSGIAKQLQLDISRDPTSSERL